ncbi:glycosyltransferase family 2 protein [uncultured Adlercreutzia sp.]|uniref:glycosyltransferase family 2 protein n=1 Tax=uncultured Adlercreutzia sp. TaxID=875803 RepID=UPI0026F39742|nr:glycosyltransferase family 2 protein [uncultured Adlercreutzia sp.]
MLVSVVIPCYYSEKMIATVVAQTREEITKAGYEYEFILVNDGSTDGTFKVISELCAEDSHVVGINCAKNSGQHNAIMAGLRQAQGELVLIMDDDMQTHPSQCVKLLDAMEGGSDVIFASWPEHKQAWWRELGSKFTVWSMRVLTDRPKEIYASNFIVLRRHIRDEVVRYQGPYVYIQGLLFRATANIKNVEVTHFERAQGTSGYNLKSLIRLWSTVLNFSMMPLRFAAVVGAVLGAIGIVSAIAIAVMRLLDPSMQTGWPSLMATILTCSGLIIMFLGLIGEYLGRVFMTINNAPQYVLKETIDNR